MSSRSIVAVVNCRSGQMSPFSLVSKWLCGQINSGQMCHSHAMMQWGSNMSFTTFLQIDLFRSYNSFSQRVCCYVDVMLKIWNEPIFLGLYLLTWPVILTMGINEKKLYLIFMVCKKKLYLFYIKFFNFYMNLFGKPLWFLLRNL